MTDAQCYRCEDPATGREHVPPRCIFPESKDLPGENLRKELITVPSCDKHNLGKSKDDEFLMVSLAGIIGNNSIGYRHRRTKVTRAIKRSSGKLLDAVFTQRQQFVEPIARNAFIDVIWGTPDHARLIKCFEHIAYGIYYSYFGERFKGDVRVHLGFLRYSDENAAAFNDFVVHRAAIDLEAVENIGKNASVFCYQFTEPDQFGLRLLRLRFYGGVDIYVAFIGSGVQVPGNFAMQLIGHGIRTVINLGDKSYEFNSKQTD